MTARFHFRSSLSDEPSPKCLRSQSGLMTRKLILHGLRESVLERLCRLFADTECRVTLARRCLGTKPR